MLPKNSSDFFFLGGGIFQDFGHFKIFLGFELDFFKDFSEDHPLTFFFRKLRD